MLRTKEEILSRIKMSQPTLSAYGVDKVGIFGSYVANQQHENSDVDILISFNQGQENFDNFMSVCHYFEELLAPTKVEIVTLNGLSPYIEPEILKQVEYV